MAMVRGLMLLSVCALLSACSGDGTLRNQTTTGNGPEEFNIVPTKPLQMPPDYNALPVPLPAGMNLVDQRPKADAIEALGGNPRALASTGVPSSDSAVVSYAGRNGIDPQIRATLRQEDADFREREARWSSLKFPNVDRYASAYSRQTLDAASVAEWWRRQGITTPAFPPEG